MDLVPLIFRSLSAHLISADTRPGRGILCIFFGSHIELCGVRHPRTHYLIPHAPLFAGVSHENMEPSTRSRQDISLQAPLHQSTTEHEEVVVTFQHLASCSRSLNNCTEENVLCGALASVLQCFCRALAVCRAYFC